MNDSSPPPLPAPPPAYPAEFERSWQAGDGTVLYLRPLRPDDLDREVAFIAGLSQQTLYYRLQYSSRSVSREDAARLLELDYRDRMAVGALSGAAPDETIVGVSRYARIDGSDQAECAIVVADAWQGRGVGTELMRSLAQAARASGIRTLPDHVPLNNVRWRLFQCLSLIHI